MKRAMTLAAAAAGTFLAAGLLLSPAALAQQNQGQGGGWGGALDQLNRTVNPQNYENERRAREEERVEQRDRRYEGSSSRDGGRSEYGRWSDNDLRNQFGRISDEQRQLQRERRAIEDEMDRRGLSRR